MPVAHVAADLDMHYVIDDFTDPWRKPETILLLHGSSESHAMWFGWVPHLARQFRVVRTDMRGMGALLDHVERLGFLAPIKGQAIEHQRNDQQAHAKLSETGLGRDAA